MSLHGRPKRSLGQNFLVDPTLARRIVDAAPIEPGDTVVEIGPGRGALTHGLRERTDRLVLVELDDALAAHWSDRAQHDPGITLLHADVLELSLAALGDPAHTVVVGNIPYNITSPLLFHLLARPRPRAIVVMVQKEVADRLRAEPGSKAYGALTVGIRTVAEVDGVLRVPPGAFRPRPRVDSAVVRLVPHRPPRLTVDEEGRLRHVVRAAFQWRRKQIAKVLRDHPDLALGARADGVLDAVGLPAERRPDQIAPETWVALAQAWADARARGAG
ncbi:MAG: 16S rRNA (adenine(1518)-N(6)/adenine(1519)-N(6))-dimethyltransferase RsmA [Gemmatimonadota bacterium]|nr:ribosomal RNA small subunit methyltransferase A [Gemmatimonadota bacterium]